MCNLELLFRKKIVVFYKKTLDHKYLEYMKYLFIFTFLFSLSPLYILNTMLNTTNYSMTSQFSVFISLQSFLIQFFTNQRKSFLILTNQIKIYVLIFILLMIIFGQKIYKGLDEGYLFECLIDIIKLMLSFSLYAISPYFFNKYLKNNSSNNLNSNKIICSQSDGIDLFDDNSLQRISISNDDDLSNKASESQNQTFFLPIDFFDELEISTIIHLFELIIYTPFAYLNEEPKGQVNDLIVRIFLLKRKNLLLTSFFLFYLGYKYFVYFLKKLEPSSIELIWFYFSFFGTIFGLTYGRDYMAAINAEKILRIIGLLIIVTIILIKSISPPFPSYLPYYDSTMQSEIPFYKFIEIDQSESNQYVSLNNQYQDIEYDD